MTRLFLPILLSLFVNNFSFADDVPIKKLGLSTPEETTVVFMELFNKKLEEAKKAHPGMTEIKKVDISDFTTLTSAKSPSFKANDTDFSKIVGEIFTFISKDKATLEEISKAAEALAKERYEACSIEGADGTKIVYKAEEDECLDQGKCHFDGIMNTAVRESRARSALAKVEDPTGIKLADLIALWDSIQGELGGFEYKFLFPVIVGSAPDYSRIRDAFDFQTKSTGPQDRNWRRFNCSSKNDDPISKFFIAIAGKENEEIFSPIVEILKLASIKSSFYYTASGEVPKWSIHSLLILDEHGQMYGLEVLFSD